MKSALKLAPKAKFDVLISDIGLPDGDGWELMRKLREQIPNLKGIAMSGYGMRTDLEKSKQAGFAGHIIKPFGPVELNAALKKVLGDGQRASAEAKARE